MIDPIETAAAAGLGTAAGGFIVRLVVGKWLKDREEFERVTHTRLESMNTALVAAKEAAKDYVDSGIRNVRDEGETARRVLREHVDHEDKILRDRYHEVDTRTQVLANVIGSMREELKKVSDSQAKVVEALGEVNVTLAALPKAPKA